MHGGIGVDSSGGPALPRRRAGAADGGDDDNGADDVNNGGCGGANDRQTFSRPSPAPMAVTPALLTASRLGSNAKGHGRRARALACVVIPVHLVRHSSSAWEPWGRPSAAVAAGGVSGQMPSVWPHYTDMVQNTLLSECACAHSTGVPHA